MGLRIGTNTQSIAAQRHLGVTNHQLQRSQEKLASGARITRAADDAAGLAISEGMRAQIRSIRQDVRNASDGISMVQVAEGGMNEISNILIRFRELSIQSASDTISDTERSFIEKEVQQLKEEVSRIALSTEFNGRQLLSGEGGVVEVQVGTGNDPFKDRFAYNTEETMTTLDSLGLTDVSVASKEAAQNNLEAIDGAISTLAKNRADLGALQNRLQSTINNLNIYDENLAAARSRIYDVDVANEVSNLTKQNILAQVGTTVLGQANSNSQLALQLL